MPGLPFLFGCVRAQHGLHWEVTGAKSSVIGRWLMFAGPGIPDWRDTLVAIVVTEGRGASTRENPAHAGNVLHLRAEHRGARGQEDRPSRTHGAPQLANRSLSDSPLSDLQ